ncbi:hypothetical protein PSECIP111951_03565 [Pseudoalteromonas holothuriae]|uniref:Pilus assembly protein FimV n=1 Tax=Pseudoalteromonas holothuriae TaxID=2963714 RepID=A0ABN8UQD1_9GAMM|nr:hypothetical protein PSECIP111951_03565 [Pseudoalteromonas sp. CIP111951]
MDDIDDLLQSDQELNENQFDVSLDDIVDDEDEVPEQTVDEQPELSQLQSVDDLLNELDEEELDDWDDDLGHEEEIALGDDPLADEVDLSEEGNEEELEDLVEPSMELESYPELELDDSLGEPSISQTEQSLTDAMAESSLATDELDNELDELNEEMEDSDLDLEPLDDELDEPDATLGDALPDVEHLAAGDEEALSKELDELATDDSADEALSDDELDGSDVISDALDDPEQSNNEEISDEDLESLPEFELGSDDAAEDEILPDVESADSDEGEALSEELDELASADEALLDDELDLESLAEFDEQAAQESLNDELDESDVISDALDDPEQSNNEEILDEDVESLPELELESDDADEALLDDELDLESLAEFDEQAAQESLNDELDESDVIGDALDDPAQSNNEEIPNEDLESLPEFELESDDDVDEMLPDVADDDEALSEELDELATDDSADEALSDDELDLESLAEFDEQAAQESLNDELDESDVISDALDDPEQSNNEEIPNEDLESVPEFELESDDAVDEMLPDVEHSVADEDDTLAEASIDEAAIEDEFMSDLTQSDFDSLLNELAEPQPIEPSELDDVEVDFDSLLMDEEVNEDIESETIEGSDEQFVDIDDLLAQSDDFEKEDEPYIDPNMDVGLTDFDSLLAGENAPDVDLEEQGFSAKLDLARAYIEIEDYDSASKVVDDVLSHGPDGVQQEATSLKDKIKGNT